MKNKLILLILSINIAHFAFSQMNVDISCGLVPDKDAFNFSTKFPINQSYKCVNVAMDYQVWRYFGLGAWIGYIYNSPMIYGVKEKKDIFFDYSLSYGIKAIFGNINNGFAVALNIGIIPSIGFYIKNFMLDIGFGYGDSQVNNIYDLNGDLLESTDDKIYYPYMEIGYSIPVLDRR
jgi:hypothetical protein